MPVHRWEAFSRQCSALTGEFDITWQCFVTDPYPAADYPEKKPSNRRFVHYYAIAKCLGVNQGWQEPREASPMRAEAHRRALYPDATGVATKVGYKRARDGEEPPSVSPPDLSADLW